MTKRMWIVLAVPALVMGQFGLSIVSDPGTYGHLINSLNQAIRDYQLAQQAYAVSMQAYQNLERASRNIQHKDVWSPAPSAWAYPQATNTYGTTDGWVRSVANGTNAAPGYRQATVPLANYSNVWGGMSTARQNQVSRQYGTVELQDAATINAMNQVGSVRQQALRNDQAIANLAADSNSPDPAMNTQVGVLNQISAGAVINARQQQAANQMLATMLDQQTVAAKLQRDAMAQSIAEDIVWRQSATASRDAIWGGTNASRYQRLP